MSKQVEIEALKAFNKTPQGDLCEPGDRFAVDESRADELERLKLAKRAGGETQAAPKPLNKAAPKPKAKG